MKMGLLAATAMMTLLLAGSLCAQEGTEKYIWTGPGTTAGLLAPRAGNKIDGESHCEAATMTIRIRVEGKSVTGVLELQRHGHRHFHTTLGIGGMFKAATEIGERERTRGPAEGTSAAGQDDNQWHVSGIINENKAEFSVDGFCNFQGRLTRR